MKLFYMSSRLNKKSKWNFLGLIFLGAQILFAQTGSNPSPVNYNIDVYPKTPEAAAQSKFVDIPAGSYTGVADFSIPLYTIEFDGGNIPIELRYTTTGIKVGEIASRAGLGWVLNAGPSLSQQVIGVHDKNFPRPVIPTTHFDIGPAYSDSYIIALKAIGVLRDGGSPYDVKPDIFTYSLLNSSGKYIIDSDGLKGIPMPYNQTKIWPSNYLTQMNIIDESGVQYTFNDDLQTVINTRNTCSDAVNSEFVYSDPNFKIQTIKSIKNQEVKYYYNQNVNAKYMTSVTTQERLSIEGLYPGTGVPPPPSLKCYNYTSSALDKALTEIHFEGGKVIFSYNNNDVNNNKRLDVDGEVYLTGVIVKNSKNETIKDYTLIYDYFESLEQIPTHSNFLDNYVKGMNRRLRLKTVRDNLTNGTHQLEYYETAPDGKKLPIRVSNDQDYWGVFNGKGNGNKSTPYTKYTKDGITRVHESGSTGANKEPDITYGKLGNLFKITYPTGGYTQIEYEADDYIKAPYAPPVYEYTSNGWEPSLSDEEPPVIFEIPSNSYNRKIRFNNTRPPGETTWGGCIWQILKFNEQTNQYVLVDSGGGSATSDRNDPPGTYQLKVIPGENGPVGCYAEYYWLNEIIVHNSETRQAGTIRVKKIESFDNNDGKIIREYTYKEPTVNHVLPYTKSSGKNLGNEVFMSITTQEYPLDHQGKYAKEVLLTNNPGWQTATVRGKPIGYDYVQEKYVSESNPSRSYRKEYKFKNDIDDQWLQHNPYSPINYTWPIEGLDRGLVLGEKLFDSNNVLIKETIKEYQYDTHFNFNSAMYIGGQFLGEGLEIIPTRRNGASDATYDFLASTFPIKNYWITDTLTTTINYKTPTDFLTTIQHTNYSIPQYKHTYPVRTTTSGSTGETMMTEYYYPQDLNAYYEQSELMGRLVQRNQLSSPVITKNFLDGLPVSEQRTHYFHFNYANNDVFTGFILPKFIYVKKGEIGEFSLPEDRKITYHSYDNQGNLTQYKMENGIDVSIIWGYNNKYPIAKVENIQYNSIPAAQLNNAVAQSNTGTEASLRTSLQALREILPATAMITTYTYKPLVGVTSMMSPNGQESFYIYDTAGRLDKILDQYGHVLKKMEYHYKN